MHHSTCTFGNLKFTNVYFQTSGLRALARAPLTLSPLGLEEHEEVVPRGDVVPVKQTTMVVVPEVEEDQEEEAGEDQEVGEE